MRNSAETDQHAAAARDCGRQHTAMHNGQPVTIRTVTVEASPSELEALERGEPAPGIQAQIDRQFAEDAVIDAIERGGQAG